MKVKDKIKKINEWSKSGENFLIICIFFVLIASSLVVLAVAIKEKSQPEVKYNVIKVEKVREIEKLDGSLFKKRAIYTTIFLVTYKDEDGIVHIDEEVKGYGNSVKVGGKETYYQKGADGVKLYISEKDYKKIMQINNNNKEEFD